MLYENVTKTTYTGEGKQQVVTLDTRQDIVEMLDYLDKHPTLADKAEDYIKYGDADKIRGIAKSVKKYGTISVKQMKYIDVLLKVYADVNK
jgi:hypothetical protein